MSKRVSDNRVRVETWTVKAEDRKVFPDGRKQVAKVTVRNSRGQFHGATNFKGTRLG